jgi:hypothetical protein
MIPREILDRFEQFAWGERDCVHFAAAVREFFGAEPVEIPAYSTEAEAKRIIASCGGLKKMLTDRLGPMQSADKAQTGDTVLATFASIGEIVGVAAPPYFWLLDGKSGFIPVKMTFAVGCWPCRV